MRGKKGKKDDDGKGLEEEIDLTNVDLRLVKRLQELNPTEQRALLNQFEERSTALILKHRHNYAKDHALFGYFADPHVGEKQFSEKLWVRMCHEFRKRGINTVYGVGDNLEGMSGRDGQVFDLAQIGFSAQVNYLEQLVKAFPDLHFHCIDGNHDGWYFRKNNGGVIVGEEMEKRCPNWHFLGQMESDVELYPGIVMKLFHANDGTAYANSYKLQKLIESFTGGEKPNIVLSGHYHKHLAQWNRNVFAVECGTLCGQTLWMRGKKIPAHMGFGVMDVWYNKTGIDHVDHTFFFDYDTR